MSVTVNTTSAINGPLWGERASDWAEIQEPQFRLVYEAVLIPSLPRSAMDYLDVGCGSGMAAALAASLGATVTGIDASPELLAIARTRAPHARFLEADLQSLPLPDKSFDLVTGFNSFQYAADPVAALREAHRVSRPGATVVIMTWGEPAGMPGASLVTALKPLLPPAPAGAPGPFALSNRDAITAFAAQADLTTTEIVDVSSPWQFPDFATALRSLNASGIAARARHHSGEAAVDAAHTSALQPFLQEDGSVRIQATFRCLFARA